MDKKINTNNGKKGGTLEGPSHDNGGIKVIITDDNRPVEVEGGEVIINKHAAKKHWKTLSKINQSAGNGVPIHEPKFKKGGNTPEQPTEKELEQRWEKKKTSIEELANNISSLRNNITRDLSNEDEKTALTALVIAIIDTTAERVGNEDSAENGHFGVTVFQKKHIKIEGNKVTLKYVGKSGVEHETSFTDEKIANALKKAISNSPSKFVFRTTDDFQIKADRINRYLSDFNVTAKDLRGYSANKWIIEKLKQINPEQEETKRQKQFNETISSIAEKIGHGKATLKNHYLVPELETEFVDNAKIIDIKKLGGDLYKKGRTIAQTPASKKDRIYGSKVNKEGSSESLDSAKSIKFDDKTLQSIESKVKEHNAKYSNKKIDLASAKAVVRRGMGAYSSSHRPTITDGKANSRVAWGLARLNAFIYKVVNGKSKSGKYSQDNDLLDELNIKHQKFSEGGNSEEKVALIIKTDNGKWFHLIGKDGNDFYAIIDGDSRLYVVKDMAKRWGYKLLSAKQYNDYYNVPERYRMYEHRRKLKTGGEIESERKVFYSIWNNYVGRIELGYSNIETENGINNGVFLSLSDALKGLFDFIKGGLEYGNYSLAKDYPKSKFTIEQVDTSKKPSKGQEFYSKVVYTITAKEVLDLYEINRLKKGGELEKGIKVEREHIATARKLFNNEITPEQAAESIAREHIKEDPKYYTKLSSIEKHKKGTNISKFKGLDKALSEYEDLDVLSYIEDPNISNVYLFLFSFKRNYKNLNDKFGIFIYNDNTQKFIQEPDSLTEYNTKYEKLDKKYPKLNVLKHVKYKYEKGANINPNLIYKKGDTIRFNYGRADERKVLIGIITDYLNNNEGYVVTAGYSQIAVDEKDVLDLDEVKETEKRFLFFEQGGVADFDIADYYEMTFAGGGAIEKAKQIITQKIGLNEEHAEYLISMSPKLAIWLADSIVKEEIRDFKLTPNQTQNTEAYYKQYVLNKINERGNFIRTNYGGAIRIIIDWIAHPLTPNQNLKELSFQEAEDKAHIFHEELKVLGGDVDYTEPKENSIIKEYSETNNVKYYWVYIPSNFCNIESSRMGHCGRTGYGNTLISLRSIKPLGNGHTISDSHVTIAYNPNEGLFYQTKGKKNQKPAEKYYSYIFDLITDMTKKEITFPMASEYTGQIDETTLEFNGFGSEYDSKEDYGFENMTKEQIEILYSIKPDIFRNFEGQYLLYETEISDIKPNTTFTLKKTAKYVEDLVRVDRNLSSNIVYEILTGDTNDYYDSWSYNYEDGWESAIDYYLDKKNEDTIIDEIVRITNYSKDEVTEKGIIYYLKGEDDNFDSDYFDNIKRAIATAISNAERFDYENYLHKQLKDALSGLGIVNNLNDEGVEIRIKLFDFLTAKEISNYMKELGTEELEDVFFEAESNGEIELPDLDIDERYTPDASKEDFNSILSGIDLESGFKKGGSITATKKNKVAKVMHEWKAGRLHSGSKKGPIVKDQKQAVAIALSQAGLSKKETGGGVGYLPNTFNSNENLYKEDLTYSLIKEFGNFGIYEYSEKISYTKKGNFNKGNQIFYKTISKYAIFEIENGNLKKVKSNISKKLDANEILKEVSKNKMSEGGNFDKETYDKWKSLVNMTYSELKKFYESEEGKIAGLTTKQAKELDIKSGRESAKWIMKMKQTNVSDWTPKMWEWAKRQISFISRMSGTKWPLYDEDGNKTRKHTSLLIWGNNPEKANAGLLLVAQYAMNKKEQKDKELNEYKSKHGGLEPWEVEAKKWKY